jgi:hypothetical protein
MLTISAYDEAERRAIINSCYPAIRAFRPAAFQMANFPTRVTDERELVRYADIMSELEDRRLYTEALYSSAEIDLMRDISDRVESVTKSLGHSVRPFMSLFAPITVLRAVRSLGKSNLSVMEIGPGSGYLGAYLIRHAERYGDLAVHFVKRYYAVDNTQALYLWQNRFFSTLDGSFTDYAEGDSPAGNSRVSMLPWWKFAELYKAPPKLDVVICDAAMGEMDTFAANYVIRLAAQMLSESDVGAFLFRHIGEQRINSMPYIEDRFAAAGFSKTMLGDVTAFSLKPLAPIPDGARLSKRASDLLPIDPRKILDSYAFFDFMDLHGRLSDSPG